MGPMAAAAKHKDPAKVPIQNNPYKHAGWCRNEIGDMQPAIHHRKYGQLNPYHEECHDEVANDMLLCILMR